MDQLGISPIGYYRWMKQRLWLIFSQVGKKAVEPLLEFRRSNDLDHVVNIASTIYIVKPIKNLVDCVTSDALTWPDGSDN